MKALSDLPPFMLCYLGFLAVVAIIVQVFLLAAAYRLGKNAGEKATWYIGYFSGRRDEREGKEELEAEEGASL